MVCSHPTALWDLHPHWAIKEPWLNLTNVICLQIICSCLFCWDRMGPQSLREASDFGFITVGRLMKQTQQGCLGRYLKLDLIFTTNAWKLYHGVYFLDRYWSQSIAVCRSQSQSQCVQPAAYFCFSNAAFALLLSAWLYCEKYDDGTLSRQLWIQGLLLLKVVCLMGKCLKIPVMSSKNKIQY